MKWNVMFEVKKGDKEYPTSFRELQILIKKLERKNKLQKIMKKYER